MTQASRLPIRYGIVVMTAAATIAATIWTLAFLIPLHVPIIFPSWVEMAVSSVALAALLTLLLTIEAIAHERLVSDSFDPLARCDSKRLEINRHVLQNTLEQLPLFGAGIAMVCWLYPFEPAFRATIAATAVWVVARWAFWIGYHRGPQHRIAGLVGAAQSMIILLGTLAVLGWRLGGLFGATLVPGIFSIGELMIINALRRRR